ncbi:hypothetical protein BDV24DRAFT_102124 [Aspergillus arachidicola]|uniref:Uncharacterized protein n=1 Tax=Aspergillus arachidicola TaxID=656916 RepID=A0A5N6YK88_9EURO|nr:hypothetical protein BDV24DRAFT_102124 [Aspergillus arachidicola]
MATSRFAGLSTNGEKGSMWPRLSSVKRPSEYEKELLTAEVIHHAQQPRVEYAFNSSRIKVSAMSFSIIHMTKS